MSGVEVRFGEALRMERERRGMSLEGLCAETKVNARQMEALERGDYDALPGGVFRRGIVRAYLHALALDETQWMPRFQSSYEGHLKASGKSLEADDEAWVTFAQNVKKNRGKGRDRTALRWMGVALLALLLGVAAFFVWRSLHQQMARRSSAPAIPGSAFAGPQARSGEARAV